MGWPAPLSFDSPPHMARERNHFHIDPEAHKHVVVKVARSWRREAASHDGLTQHPVVALGSALPPLIPSSHWAAINFTKAPRERSTS